MALGGDLASEWADGVLFPVHLSFDAATDCSVRAADTSRANNVAARWEEEHGLARAEEEAEKEAEGEAELEGKDKEKEKEKEKEQKKEKKKKKQEEEEKEKEKKEKEKDHGLKTNNHSQRFGNNTIRHVYDLKNGREY